MAVSKCPCLTLKEQYPVIVSMEELWRIYDLFYSTLKQVKQNS